MTCVRIFELLRALDSFVRVLRNVLQHVTKLAVTDAVLVLLILENCAYVCTCIVYSSDIKLIQCVAKIQNR